MSDIDATVKTPTTPQWLRRRVVELRICTLVVESGPDAGMRFGPLGEQTTIGREDWCDVGLTDPLVSKQHCELAWGPDGLRLRDLGSTNGVLYDGMRVYDVVFTSERRFQIGSTCLRVVFEEGSQELTSHVFDPSGSVIGASAPMRRLFGMMRRVAPRDLPILLLGETGTGKTAIARAIHKSSSRHDRPFVAINCAALPAELVESTLFGHVRGAFTGAHRGVAGIFEQAAGGSVLLDEIGDMPRALQAKLLSVLEDRCVRPVGGEREVPVDFRLFCATNRQLAADVATGSFRQDLYYRIAGIEMTVPPLRDRIADIPMLTEWFVLAHARRVRESGARCDVCGASDDAVRMLEQHAWPGNVRELENVLARAVALAESDTITPDDVLLTPLSAGDDTVPSTPLPPTVELAAAPGIAPSYAGPASPLPGSFKEFKAAVLEAHERAYFQQLMSRSGGNITKAAEISGLSRVHVRAMVKRYGV